MMLIGFYLFFKIDAICQSVHTKNINQRRKEKYLHYRRLLAEALMLAILVASLAVTNVLISYVPS